MIKHVALLAEGVDRNCTAASLMMVSAVALLAEGVDRNSAPLWLSTAALTVALLAEGVDRNSFKAMVEADRRRSPSSRRAWIEIRKNIIRRLRTSVALLAEGVDRNGLKMSGPW